jgi:hypothetical protein
MSAEITDLDAHRERRRRQHSDQASECDGELVNLVALRDRRWARAYLKQMSDHSHAVGLLAWRSGLAPHPDDLLAYAPMDLPSLSSPPHSTTQ